MILGHVAALLVREENVKEDIETCIIIVNRFVHHMLQHAFFAF
jgi:hypothetical protein